MIKQGQGTATGSGDRSCESRAALFSAFIRGYRAKHGQTNPWDPDAEMITRHPVAAAEDQKSDVPRKRPTKVVPHVMDAEHLVVDQSLHDVEDAPAGEDESEMEASVW